MDMRAEFIGGRDNVRPGIYGAITARAEAQVLRLSLIYALLDESALPAQAIIDTLHPQAGLAVWRYCDASAARIFGRSLGDPVADEIYQMLQHAPQGMTRWEISNHSAATVPPRRSVAPSRCSCSTAESGQRRTSQVDDRRSAGVRSDAVVLTMSTQHYEENEDTKKAPTLAEKAHTRTEFLRILRFLRSRCSLSSSRYREFGERPVVRLSQTGDCVKDPSPDSTTLNALSQTASGGVLDGGAGRPPARGLDGVPRLSVSVSPVSGQCQTPTQLSVMSPPSLGGDTDTERNVPLFKSGVLASVVCPPTPANEERLVVGAGCRCSWEWRQLPGRCHLVGEAVIRRLMDGDRLLHPQSATCCQNTQFEGQPGVFVDRCEKGMRVALKAAVNAGSRLSCRSFKLKSAIVFSSGRTAWPGLVVARALWADGEEHWSRPFRDRFYHTSSNRFPTPFSLFRI